MNWFDYTLVALWLLNIVLTTIQIGKPRKPLTAEAAAVSICLGLLMVTGLLATRGAL